WVLDFVKQTRCQAGQLEETLHPPHPLFHEYPLGHVAQVDDAAEGLAIGVPQDLGVEGQADRPPVAVDADVAVAEGPALSAGHLLADLHERPALPRSQPQRQPDALADRAEAAEAAGARAGDAAAVGAGNA